MRPFFLVALSLTALTSCTGPAAPDAELCKDVIERFCAQPRCGSATLTLNLPDTDCEATVEARTGCASPDFTFPAPGFDNLTRSRVIDCRLPLVRDSTARFTAPRCEYADETMRNCPDLVRFLGGTP
ncbi:MAG: hypothetical protein U0228_21535 [Myxococcaceae bacterium]